MKNHSRIVCLAAIITVGFLLPSFASAGSKQRHRWEGVAIGVGAAVLGHAIVQAHRDGSAPITVRVAPERWRHERRHYRHGHGPRHKKHWRKSGRPKYKKVWNPGHYNRRGHWVPGHWIKVKRGRDHWPNQRVWYGRKGRFEHRWDD